jgi:hypothetical protein
MLQRGGLVMRRGGCAPTTLRCAATRFGRPTSIGFDGRAALPAVLVGREYHAERDFNVVDGSVEMSQDEWRENGRVMLDLVNKLKHEVATVKAGAPPLLDL